ncbi:MAG TPA: tautomerase family protein [Burkholderiales bacterium]|nr:tautomerase family protein [Burkholderiales bacterium]
MPYVRIDLAQGRPKEFHATLADIVYRAMVETISVPENDKYIVVHEHAPGHVFITLVGIARDDVSFGNGEAQYAA